MSELTDAPCPHCSSAWQRIWHGGPCPKVRATEYYPDGSVRRVEFHDGVQFVLPQPAAVAEELRRRAAEAREEIARLEDAGWVSQETMRTFIGPGRVER